MDYEKKEVQIKGGACHFLPESSCLTSLGVNKEREATSIARVNPPAVNGDIAAEHSGHATFFLHFNHHKDSFRHCGQLNYWRVCCTIATKKPEADRATGFVFLTQMQEYRQERENSSKGVILRLKCDANVNKILTSVKG